MTPNTLNLFFFSVSRAGLLNLYVGSLVFLREKKDVDYALFVLLTTYFILACIDSSLVV